MSYPKKPSQPEYPIHQLLQNRWSPRVFDQKPINELEIHQLLEAGRWAPSSNNLQPWRIIWGLKGSETYDRIYNCLVEFNQSWAVNATALMACAFKKTMPNGVENFHALHDLGAFSAILSIQAQSMGIAAHQMAGIDFMKAKLDFGFPKDYHVATAIALGYFGGRPSDLPDDLKRAEIETSRLRHPLNQFAFNGNFEDLIKA